MNSYEKATIHTLQNEYAWDWEAAERAVTGLDTKHYQRKYNASEFAELIDTCKCDLTILVSSEAVE